MAKFTQMAPTATLAAGGAGVDGATAATPKKGSTRIMAFGPRLASGPESFP